MCRWHGLQDSGQSDELLREQDPAASHTACLKLVANVYKVTLLV